MKKKMASKGVLLFLLTFSLCLWSCEESKEDTSDLVGTWYLTGEVWASIVTTSTSLSYPYTANENDGVTISGDVTGELPAWSFREGSGYYRIFGEGYAQGEEYDLDVFLSNADTSAELHVYIDTDMSGYEEVYYCDDPDVTWDVQALAFTITNAVFKTADGMKSATASGSYTGYYMQIPANTPTKIEFEYDDYESLTIILKDDGTYTTNEQETGTWIEDGNTISFDVDETYEYEISGDELTLSLIINWCEGDVECLNESAEEAGFETGSISDLELNVVLTFSRINPDK